MTIKNVLELLKTAHHPVARVLHKGEHFKVLVIAFKKGMRLEEHEAPKPTKLTVISGAVVYREAEREITLNIFDEVEIPVKVKHEVDALEDSICLLSQG